jgi:iron complex outermembrane recepter protein
MSKSGRRPRSNRSRNLAVALSGLAAPALVMTPWARAVAQEVTTLEEVVVTATRRTESVQDVPINITALNGDALESQGISSLAGIMRGVPGFFVVNQGARTANRVVARGLNATPVNANDTMGNNAGGTVSTYMGEIPLYVDLQITDLERVEVLLGPQGTLYGAGTMGGAVRYIPRRPVLGERSLSFSGSSYGLAHSDGIGADAGFVLNLPFSDAVSARAVLNYTDDPGFIDYDYLVREPGVSTPQPDFGNPADVAANLRTDKDADDLQMWSGRVGLRWQPSDSVDANLTYYYQKQDAGGRSINHLDAMGTDRYTSAHRFVEPNKRENQLAALEIEADLGFASLTSASGVSWYDEIGQRDQTDLLITLEFSYEAFPDFSAFTLEEQKDRNFSQELRLVSTADGPIDWIFGGFYNHSKSEGSSKEYTPGYDTYLGGSRPDNLEYYSAGVTKLDELAFFGEVTWHINDRWQITGGGRWYDYDLDTLSAVDFPLYNTIFEGAAPDAINLEFNPGGQKDSGTLWKFNTSFDFTDDVLGYLTVSEGYRIGNSNGLALCTGNEPPGQAQCAQPNEFQYFPDSTVNYEVGMRSQWFGKRLTVNAAAYYIDWKDPQLAAVTEGASLPITINGAGARSQGLEINFDAWLTDQFRVWGNYAMVKAELSELAPDLIAYVPGTGGFANEYADGLKGDRLPGSPRHQGSINLRYEMPLSNGWQAGFNYGLSAISNVLTKTGGRGDGEALPGFAVNYASVDVQADAWTVTLYADNLFDKYAATGVRRGRGYLQTVADQDDNPVPLRYYYKDVLRPLEVGLRFRYDFQL